MYEGQFVNGMKHGFGKINYNSSDIYRGTFCEGAKEGTGTEYLGLEDEYYEGEFKNNQREGHGKCLNHKLELRDGQWKRNKFMGKVETSTFSLLYFNKLGMLIFSNPI